MRISVIVSAAILIGLSACSPGSESGLTKAEREKYDAWMAEQEQQSSTQPELQTNVTAASAELERLESEFLDYETRLNALLDVRDSLPGAEFDEKLDALRETRSQLVARREALEAVQNGAESTIRPAVYQATYDTPFMQAVSSLSNDRLLFALMSATVTEGPVKQHIDDDLTLKAELAETIASQRTSSPDVFRARALNTLEKLDRDIDDNQALIVILKTP